jgi:hypothetical protein
MASGPGLARLRTLAVTGKVDTVNSTPVTPAYSLQSHQKPKAPQDSHLLKGFVGGRFTRSKPYGDPEKSERQKMSDLLPKVFLEIQSYGTDLSYHTYQRPPKAQSPPGLSPPEGQTLCPLYCASSSKSGESLSPLIASSQVFPSEEGSGPFWRGTSGGTDRA